MTQKHLHVHLLPIVTFSCIDWRNLLFSKMAHHHTCTSQVCMWGSGSRSCYGLTHPQAHISGGSGETLGAFVLFNDIVMTLQGVWCCRQDMVPKA